MRQTRRLSIDGDVANTGTLNANNGAIVIEGAVSGGKATIQGTGEIAFGGASAANVIFEANSTGKLALDAVRSPARFLDYDRDSVDLQTSISLTIRRLAFPQKHTYSRGDR